MPVIIRENINNNKVDKLIKTLLVLSNSKPIKHSIAQKNIAIIKRIDIRAEKNMYLLIMQFQLKRLLC